MLSELVVSLEADFACLAELDAATDRIARVTTAGDRETSRAWEAITGAPVERMARSWRPERPRPAELNRFSRLIVGTETAAHHPGLEWIFDRYYRPFGLASQLRALLYEGDLFLGYLMVARTGDRKSFRAREPVAASSLQRARRALDALWHDTLPSEVGYAVVPSGETDARAVQLSPSLEVWATSSRRRELAAAAHAFERGGDTTFYLDGARLECSAIAAPEVRSVHLTVRPPSRVRLDGSHGLSERQRVVAQLAGAGATLAEIARELSVAESTVKHHLRGAYERLGVANRVELVEALRRGSE
ncbi:MAG: helix-turn-helix transcriptional regulator [Myxococcales bacterium]|nr:helix-turn-helix transcriptional regulator [Myxococcales bacterium]